MRHCDKSYHVNGFYVPSHLKIATEPFRKTLQLKYVLMAVVFGCLGQLNAAELTTMGSFCGRPSLSADGLTIVGTTTGVDGQCFSRGYEAFLDSGDGKVQLGTLEGASSSSPSAPGELASANGSMVAGDSDSTPFRWSSVNGMEAIPLPTISAGVITGGTARTLSADGDALYGTFGISTPDADFQEHTFRWHDGASEDLGVPFGLDSAVVYSGTSDGQKIAGVAYSRSSKFGPVTNASAFIWDVGEGYSELGQIPSAWSQTAAIKISPDGSTVVGSSAVLGGWGNLFRWSTRDGFQPLETVDGEPLEGTAGWVSTNSDGSVIVGTARDDGDFFNFVWSKRRGIRDLRSVLINDHGLTENLIPDLFGITNMSIDTTHLVGPVGTSDPWEYMSIRLDKPLISPVGDFDGDHYRSATDIDLLSQAVVSGSADEGFDLNMDGDVNDSDRNYWILELEASRLGDADLDGDVDFSDFLSLSSGFGEPGGWAEGDFSGDGQVLFEDFVVLSSNYGFGNSETTEGASVPEPTSSLLLILGMLIGLRRTKERRDG